MLLLRYFVKYTVTDSLLNTEASSLKCPPSAWIHFLTHVTGELITLPSTAALLMLLVALRIGYDILDNVSPTDICSPAAAKKRFLYKSKLLC